jgi:HPt (histidine-containing phosphotransfer) domain-containing protein
MVEPADVPGATRIPGLVRVAGGLVGAAGLTVLAGWIFERPALAALGSRQIPMAPSTALLFVLFAATVLARTRPSPPRVAGVGAMLGGGAAFALLVLSILGVHPDLEHLGITIVDTPGSPPVGHMSPVTAGGFLLVATSLLASLRENGPGMVVLTRLGAAFVTGVSLVLGLGYLYGTPFLYRGAFIPPAFLTCVAFALLGVAVLGLVSSAPGSADEAPTRPARLVIGIFAVLAVGIVGTGLLLQRSFEARYRAGVEQELQAIVELKTRELLVWRAEREADAALFADNPAFLALARRLIGDPTDEAARAAISDWFVRVRANPLYSWVSLLDGRGVERLSQPADPDSVDYGLRPAVVSSLRERRLVWVDLHRNVPGGAIHLDVIAPLTTGGTGPAGAVALEVAADLGLYPLLAGWPRPSRTAEVTLARREGEDVVVLSPLRFQPDAPLTLRVPMAERQRPVVQAALGAEGTVYGRSYRGEPVVAAVRAVAGSPWLFVARVDVAEAFAAVRSRLWVTLALVGLIVTGAGAGVRTIWQGQRLHTFLSETPRLLVELTDAGWSDDLVRLADVAHSLKSSAGAIRATALAAVLADLEMSAKGGDDRRGGLVTRAVQEYDAVVTYLRESCPQLSEEAVSA